MAALRFAPRFLAHAGPSTWRALAARTYATAGSNPALSFPCVDANELRSQRIIAERDLATAMRSAAAEQATSADAEAEAEDGPEPAYAKIVSGYQTFRHRGDPLKLDYGGALPSFDIAYETWGKLNADASNAILLHTGLSASSHAHSHDANKSEGWWERFIGPGRAIDTDRFFVICTNVVGGCYGSTGPSSIDPTDGMPYATRFPILSIFDMIRAQLLLLDHLGISRLYASVGSSMGGMQSVALTHLAPERVGRLVSISGTARSSPSSIALRYAQRSVLMSDPNWNRGFYYDRLPPHTGMKLARQIATITYRSGPEWEQRFARRRRPALSPASFASPSSVQDPSMPQTPPVLCPDFLIETYLDHQGEQFCLKFDANSLLYVSKAMDLFDMSADALGELEQMRSAPNAPSPALCPPGTAPFTGASSSAKPHISTLPSSHAYLPGLTAGLANLSRHPTLILGAQSDVLFPIEQQRELAEALRQNGNKEVTFFELDSAFGHDTFLIDVLNVGGALRGFLS